MSGMRREFLFLNFGHALDHYLILIFATAVLSMRAEFVDSYGALLELTTLAFLFFGGAALPAGWLADRWSKRGMLVVFFLGAGSASCLLALADSPPAIEWCLALIGLFAAIYHPVGLSLISIMPGRVGWALGVNGVWGNVGVAASALLTGFLAQEFGWRVAFLLPGVLTVVVGVLYLIHLRYDQGADWIRSTESKPRAAKDGAHKGAKLNRGRTEFAGQRGLFLLLILSAAFGGLIFHSATVALPKIVTERVGFADLTSNATIVAGIFLVGASAQLLVGRYLDRIPFFRLYLVITLWLFASLIAASMVWGVMAPIVLACALFGVFALVPMNDWLVARHVSGPLRGRVYAVKALIGLSVGALAIRLIAWLDQLTGEQTVLLYCLAGSALGLIIAATFLLPSVQAMSADQEAIS